MLISEAGRWCPAEFDLAATQIVAEVLSNRVERTAHATAAAIEDVRVDHRRLHVGVTEQFLHRADVVARLQEVRCKGVAPMPRSV